MSGILHGTASTKCTQPAFMSVLHIWAYVAKEISLPSLFLGLLGIVLLTTPVYASAQNSDPRANLQQKLTQTFTATVVSPNRQFIVTPGSILVLAKDGMMMYSVNSPLPPSNNYKNGKISQGMGGFGRQLLITGITPGGGTAANYPQRRFGVGEKLWVSQMAVQKGSIAFVLYSEPDANNIRYYGELKFSFGKGAIPSPDDGLKMIGEVFTVQPPEQQAAQANVSGQYFLQQTGATLVLNQDGSFTLSAPNRPPSPGQYTVSGNSLTLTYNATGRSANFRIQGDQFFTDTGLAWVRQGGAPAAVADSASGQSSSDAALPPPPPSPPPPPPPPPPPADAVAPPPVTISLGDTKDKVVTAFGQPERIVHLGAKEIDYYKDMKVTLVNGKVTDVQ